MGNVEQDRELMDESEPRLQTGLFLDVRLEGFSECVCAQLCN